MGRKLIYPRVGHHYDGCPACKERQAYYCDRQRGPTSLDTLPYQIGGNLREQDHGVRNSGDVSPKPLRSLSMSWVCVWADHGACRRVDCTCDCHLNEVA